MSWLSEAVHKLFDEQEKINPPAPEPIKIVLSGGEVATVAVPVKEQAPAAEPEVLDLVHRIEKYMDTHNYSIDKGKDEVNIVYLEGFDLDDEQANDNEPNHFNDARLVIKYVDGKPTIVGAWQATTEPGKYWTVHPMNSAGAARVKLGQQKCWKIGKHHDHEALVQTGGEIEVYRDLNRDYKRDGDKLDKGWFGINQHWGYDLPEDNLANSSAGCLVGRTKAGHRQFMAIVKSDPRFNANFVFKTTVISAKDLLA